MKKMITVLLTLMLAAGVSVGCGKQNASDKVDKLNIVTTIFPEYDWVREILGEREDKAEITLLLDNGVDLHSYQPTADDIVKIADCDLFVYVGGESDSWVDDVLNKAANKDMKVINLLDALGDKVKSEQLVEGMQEEDHEHSHDEKITEDDIKDRKLSDFSGEWKSLYPYLKSGKLDKYCEYKAKEDGDDSTSKDTYLEKYKSSWQCDIENLSINRNTITFTYSDGNTVSAEYTYAGYQPKMTDEGEIGSVRYQFETTSADAPKYVQFNDHGHEPGEAEHFHIYYGNDSLDKLMDSKNHPFFVKEALSADEIVDELIEHQHGEEKDEHVWLSLKNAGALCEVISDALQEIDPKNKEIYAANTVDYKKKLSELDDKYQKTVESGRHKTMLFGDRFPFRYLADDYGLNYYAAFAGCSAETEASFETISFLAKKTDEQDIPCVLTIEGARHKIAETIVDNTVEKNQKILAMDSMQSTNLKDVANGTTYLSVMENNLSVLKEALE